MTTSNTRLAPGIKLGKRLLAQSFDFQKMACRKKRDEVILLARLQKTYEERYKVYITNFICADDHLVSLFLELYKTKPKDDDVLSNLNFSLLLSLYESLLYNFLHELNFDKNTMVSKIFIGKGRRLCVLLSEKQV